MFLFMIDALDDEMIASFFLLVKYNNNCAIDWITLIDKNIAMYLFSLYNISKDKYSKYFLNKIRICEMVYLYLIYVPKDN